MKINKIPFRCDFFKAASIVVLIFFCIIALSNNCRGFYGNYFINDKESPMGDKFERFVYLTLQLFDNPKGDSAYNSFSDMSNRNTIVDTSIFAKSTQLQQFLINNHVNLKKEHKFVQFYYITLPFCKSQEEAFLAVNALHYKRHGSFKFDSFKTFKTVKNG